MQINEKNNMPSGDAVSIQQEEHFLLSAVSEQPTRPERSRQLSKPLKPLRTVPLVSTSTGNPARERRQRVIPVSARQYGAATWSPYGKGANSTVEAVIEQHEFPGGDTGEMLETAKASESATSWQWVYDGGDRGTGDDFEASANAGGNPGTPSYPQTGPLPIMLEPAPRRTAQKRASGSHMAPSMLPLLVTLLIIGIIGALVCQYLLAFYR
jgi:hypothetical protein